MELSLWPNVRGARVVLASDTTEDYGKSQINRVLKDHGLKGVTRITSMRTSKRTAVFVEGTRNNNDLDVKKVVSVLRNSLPASCGIVNFLIHGFQDPHVKKIYKSNTVYFDIQMLNKHGDANKFIEYINDTIGDVCAFEVWEKKQDVEVVFMTSGGAKRGLEFRNDFRFQKIKKFAAVVSVETPVKTPAETSAEIPVETSAEIPVETPLEVSVETLLELSITRSAEPMTPVMGLVETQVKTNTTYQDVAYWQPPILSVPVPIPVKAPYMYAYPIPVEVPTNVSEQQQNTMLDAVYQEWKTIYGDISFPSSRAEALKLPSTMPAIPSPNVELSYENQESWIQTNQPWMM
jgi:hypothetical protein